MKRPTFDIKSEAIIIQVESTLSWRIDHCPNDTRDLEILSNPETKTHLIHWPDNPGDPVRSIEYLHELAHAVLSERDLFLAGGVYDMSAENHCYDLIPAVRAVDDWWADWLLDQWAPEEAREFLREHLALMQKSLQGKSLYPHDIFGIIMIVAQGRYYLGSEICLPDQFEPAIEAFLNHTPDNPSREAAEQIIQSLFDVTGIKKRIVFVADDEPYWTTESIR